MIEVIPIETDPETRRLTDPSNVVGWALVEAMTQVCERDRTIDFSKSFVDPRKLEIHFEINGIPVKFSDVMERMAESWNRHVQKAALKLFEDKARELSDILDEATRQLREKLNLEEEDA